MDSSIYNHIILKRSASKDYFGPKMVLLLLQANRIIIWCYFGPFFLRENCSLDLN